MFRSIRHCCVLVTILVSAAAMAAQARAMKDPFPPNVKRILFLGDSITQAGQYIAYLERELYTHFPDRRFQIISLGLSSETASGLSEPGHPFPRPNVHDRLERAVTEAKADLVFICYGMNDGIYYPLGEERFAKYREGIQTIVDRFAKDKTPVIVMTPPPFDKNRAKNTQPAGREEYGYNKPFEGYDQVLGAYAKWIVEQREKQGWRVVDLHSAINDFVAARRKEDPDFTLAPDAVHPNALGHWLMAQQILLQLGAIDRVDPSAFVQGDALQKQLEDRRRMLTQAWLGHVGHARLGTNKGMPLPEALEKAEAMEPRIQALAAESK